MWGIELLQRTQPPGALGGLAGRVSLSEEDVELALGGFSQRVSRGSPEDRFAALTALDWMRDRRAISPMLRGLLDLEWDVRLAAAHGLGNLVPLPAWAGDGLAQAVDDEEPGVRAMVTRALGNLRVSRAVELASHALADIAHSVRLEACRSLARLGRAGLREPAAVLMLTAVMHEPRDPHVAWGAYRALAEQGGASVEVRRAAFRYSAWGQEVWRIAGREL
jgi:HEAT repeat protein